MGKRISLEERLQKYVQVVDGCWRWTGHVTKTGYARTTYNGESRAAHRVFYEYLRGPIPEGMTLDHQCHTQDQTCTGGDTCPHRRCVNPDHLLPMTVGENASLMYPARKTHCKNGHEYTEQNTQIRIENGLEKRTCRRCHYERKHARRSAARAEARIARGWVAELSDDHCRRGHAWAEDNTYWPPGGGSRQCRTCIKAKSYRRKAA